jgi:hypothetical protein
MESVTMRAVVGLLFVLIMNVLLFFAQLGMSNANPEGSTIIFNYQNSILADYDSGNYTLNDFDGTELPTSQSQVDTEGNFFTDTFSTVKNWLLDVTGFNYLISIVNSVPNFLKIILPIEIAYAIGVLWHGFTVFLIVMFIKGS